MTDTVSTPTDNPATAPADAPATTTDGVEIVYRKVYPNGSVLESLGAASE